MLLYVGEKENGFYVEDIAHEYGEDVEYTGYIPHVSGLAALLTRNSCRHIVINIDQFLDDYEAQVLEISRARNVSGANIIIQAIGYSLHSEIVQALAAQGIKNFVVAVSLSGQKEQLERSIRGTNTILQESDPAIIQAEPEPAMEPAEPARREQPVQTASRTISIAGCCHRIGATTQAIQIIKYLHLQGYTACYLEMNNNRFVEQLRRLYSVVENDEKSGKVVYRGVDMYFNKLMYPYVLKQPYDFFVYDFGSFTDERFDLTSFFEKNFQVAVCGCFPNEFESMGVAVSKTLKYDVSYIFSFCSTEEQRDILEQMEDKSRQTFFAPYTPDAFLYSSNSDPIYQKIFQIEQRHTVQKKKRFFRRKRTP